MNEKKVREAIEYLSGYIQSNINLMEKIEGIVWIGEEPCKTAIEALEKQLSKKVENWNGQASCPRCKRLFGNMADIEMFRYWDSDCCNHCGQRLDWSE